MNRNNNYTIDPLEISIALIAFIIGVGILTLPGSLADTLNTADGWITIIVGGSIICALVYVTVRLQKEFPEQTLLQFLLAGQKSKWLAVLLGVLFSLHFLMLMGFESRMLAIVLDMYLIDRTPSVIVICTILVVTSYAVSKGVQGLIHLNVLFIPFILTVLLAILLFNVQHAKLDPILPVAPKGILHPLKGLPNVVLAYIGVEILLFFMGRMKGKDVKAWPLNIGVGIVTLFYFLITFFTYFVFGVEQSKVINFTTVELAKVVEVPGGFFERVESMMITVWTMAIFNTIAMSQLIIILIYNDLFSAFKKQTQSGNYLTPVIVFITIIIAFIPESISDTLTWGDWIGYFGFSVLILSLLVGYVTVGWRKKRRELGDRHGESTKA
ncbi:spore germination protein [Halalkalibacterium halodurans]|uniref:Spore germination protein n=2 Tax=Halalkalibacterium halodurans TaxID=86665 RepID=Q9KBD6_HALH5|nr:spore germination protein [Halalkalibacterium halodurans]MED4123974.1 spore germination protein [Halalkalibacterium halodurans]BAB05711.1 spore germination protein [Halalkalibacterium halodurans C-125]